MSREIAVGIMVLIAVVLLGLMAWGWARRTRRDARPLSTVHELPAHVRVLGSFDAQYVATTRRGLPMERIAAPGLAFRSRAQVLVTDAGIALDMPGQARIVLSADRLVDVGQATVAIDRVVERDGLVRLTWNTDTGADADTYLRARDVSARVLADAIRPLIRPLSTGSAA